jgi:hypothetical protein
LKLRDEIGLKDERITNMEEQAQYLSEKMKIFENSLKHVQGQV